LDTTIIMKLTYEKALRIIQNNIASFMYDGKITLYYYEQTIISNEENKNKIDFIVTMNIEVKKFTTSSFNLKDDLLQLMSNKQFKGFTNEHKLFLKQ